MNSSTGFKKRSLLRPPSGMLSNAREFLKVVDISQSQPIIASNIRTEVAAIQQQINILDKDKRIRTGQSSLEKTYVLNLKKWLREAQMVGQKEDDDMKILKQMGVDSYEAGFRKLWKIVTNLDLITSKITQLQAVQFLKYDEMFEGMAEDSVNGQRILQAISKGGFACSSFYLSQIALERQIQLFGLIGELKRANNNGNQSVSSSKGFTRAKDDTSQLIQQLRTQNQKLTQLLESIQRQQQEKSKKQKIKQKQEKVETSKSISTSSPKDFFAELDDKYRTQITDLNNKIIKLNQELTENKIACSQFETRLKVAEEEVKSKDFSLTKKPGAGTYEEALLEQMDKMKRGFERKIQKILDDFALKQREMRKKQYEYKNQNDKIKWEKGLLLKKFQTLTAA